MKIRILIFLLIPSILLAAPKQFCIYQESDGAIKQVSGITNVPVEFRKHAKCFAEKQTLTMAAPGEVELEGTIRREEITTDIGKINMRWPRSAEELFGRTPQRAMVEAQRAVVRALRNAGFPSTLFDATREWQVVFMDENVPEEQIPRQLVSNCHPGWMTPPANIYIVAQRIAAGCSGFRKLAGRDSDAELAATLIHEMGHVIEYHLLDNQIAHQRLRAEGFASWFELYAGDLAPIIPDGMTEKKLNEYAEHSYLESPQAFNFQGSAQDYARAALFFRYLEKRKGARGVVDMYEMMRTERLPLFDALQSKLGMNIAKIDQEMRKLIQ